MTRLPVTLFDYGVGNLHSIQKALERSGADVTITADADGLLHAPAIVLPGVGAFEATMTPLLGVRDALRERLLRGTPCLAICIGMQLLFEESEESPGVPGIGYMRGRVKRFPAHVGKIPHMGWNTLEPVRTPGPPTSAWTQAMPDPGVHVYYVHSYYVEPAKPSLTLLETRYGEGTQSVLFPAVIAHGATLATQFHPEKSSAPGLALVQQWVQGARNLLTAGGQRPNIDTPTEGSRGRREPEPAPRRASGSATPDPDPENMI